MRHSDKVKVLTVSLFVAIAIIIILTVSLISNYDNIISGKRVNNNCDELEKIYDSHTATPWFRSNCNNIIDLEFQELKENLKQQKIHDVIKLIPPELLKKDYNLDLKG